MLVKGATYSFAAQTNQKMGRSSASALETMTATYWEWIISWSTQGSIQYKDAAMLV